jgi:hypothetical protein
MRRRLKFAQLMLIALSAVASGAHYALADQGCEDMRQLCKDAKADAAKCVKQEKSEASCKRLIDVRETTCTQAEIICEPPVGEPK